MGTTPNLTYGVGGYGQGGYGNSPLENQPLGYYLQLLTSQYASPSSPKLNALLYLHIKKLDDASKCLVQMDTALDIDAASGSQLDMLGATVGVGRVTPFQPSGGVSPILDDGTYRLLIKARIGWNQWDGTIDSLYKLWLQLFPGGRIVIEDNQNMTANIVMTGSFTSIVQDLISNGFIVPRPEGVLYTYSFGTLPAFGFDVVPNAFIAGFGQGFWND